MLTGRFYPTLPAHDVERARRFYEDTLGFKVDEDMSGPDGYYFDTGQGQYLFVYKSMAPRGGTTALSFEVDDLDQAMRDLRGRGVKFEDYDMPGLKTVDGVAETDWVRGAWFKDSEGNIINVGQRTRARSHSRAA